MAWDSGGIAMSRHPGYLVCPLTGFKFSQMTEVYEYVQCTSLAISFAKNPSPKTGKPLIKPVVHSRFYETGEVAA